MRAVKLFRAGAARDRLFAPPIEIHHLRLSQAHFRAQIADARDEIAGVRAQIADVRDEIADVRG
jgi:hypothetical protein